jgi:hypothetical protein
MAAAPIQLLLQHLHCSASAIFSTSSITSSRPILAPLGVSCGRTAFFASTPRLALAVSSKSSLQVSLIDMIIAVRFSFVTATEFPCFGVWASVKLLDDEAGIILDTTRSPIDELMSHDKQVGFLNEQVESAPYQGNIRPCSFPCS